ncbi:MAG: transcription elongation factor GreA [Clostridia bacterium]|nr:transcription elongation factor GreA [Clostridia bacterium]MBO7171141.1 transcription elongation factor GreA [Clostridia bacterium]
MAEMKNYTQAGYDALQKELDFLKNVRREEVKNEVAKARSYGDLSENSEYDEAKNEEAKVEMRIHELEEMISLAHVIDESEIDHTKVSVGSIVDVKNLDTAAKKTYHIVGSYETDPLAGKISDQSAIGMGILGTSAGEKVEIELPNGKTLRLEILDVRRANA